MSRRDQGRLRAALKATARLDELARELLFIT